MKAGPCWLPEQGDLGASPSGGSQISWGAGCVDKLLPERSWRLVCSVGASFREQAGGLPRAPSVSWENPSQHPYTS